MHKLYTDGGSRNNPGPAAIGFVLLDSEDVEVTSGSRYIGEASNNYAEYMGLIAGLQTAITHEIKDLNCYLDSELVVKQIKGEYKMRNESLMPLFNKVKDLIKSFKNITFNHVPRSLNKTADMLVNKALDEALKS